MMRLLGRRAAPKGQYVVGFCSKDGSTTSEHLNGVDWYDAPIPPRSHHCWAQTRAWMNYFDPVYRCACGAISMDGKHWMERNSRKAKVAS